MIQVKFSSEKVKEFLSCVFPGIVFLNSGDDIPFFAPKICIFNVKDYSWLDLPGMKDRFIIVVSSKAVIDLDTLDGLLEFLKEVFKVKLSKADYGYVKKLDPIESFNLLKILTIVRKLKLDESVSGSVYTLFESTFVTNFASLYSIYRSLDVNYNVVFSSLVSMFLRVKDTDSVTNMSYKKVLLSKKLYYEHFKKALKMYIDLPMSEIDFIYFMFLISTDGRDILNK